MNVAESMLAEAVAFYADEANWKAVVVAVVPDGEPNAGAVSMVSGPANDGGERAREVLARIDAWVPGSPLGSIPEDMA